MTARERPAPRTRFPLLAAALAALVFGVLVLCNRNALRADVVPSGDAAADVLLVDHAKHQWLLTGHYSRFDFHHPGPFFFELRHLAERLAGGALPGPYNAHLAGVLFGNALFIGLGGAAAATLAGGGWNALGAGLAAVILVLSQAGPGGRLSDTWMPNVLIAPFFAFVLLAAQVARGRLRRLPVATFCAGALAHGYVLLLPIVGVAWPAAIAAGVHRRMRDGRTVQRAIVLCTVAIVVLFALPLLADIILHFPGNPGLIVARTLHAPAPDTPRSWAAALRFVAQYWLDLAPLPAAIAGLAALPVLSRPAARRELGALVATIALVSVLLVVIAKRAPDALYAYIGRFYFGAPLALESAAIALALAAARARTARLAACGLAIVLAVVAARTDLAGTELGDPSLRVLTTAIRDDARAHGVDTIELAFSPDEQWPAAAGLLVDLMRAGESACVVAPCWEVLFTPERLCPERAVGRRYVVVSAAACSTGCLARSPRSGVVVASDAETGSRFSDVPIAP